MWITGSLIQARVISASLRLNNCESVLSNRDTQISSALHKEVSNPYVRIDSDDDDP